MALELAPHNIRVNCYCPGIHATAMWDHIDEYLGRAKSLPPGGTIKKFSDELIALRRTGKAEDVAKVVSFLAGDDAEYITGQSINVDGGIVLT